MLLQNDILGTSDLLVFNAKAPRRKGLISFIFIGFSSRLRVFALRDHINQNFLCLYGPAFVLSFPFSADLSEPRSHAMRGFFIEILGMKVLL